MFYHLVVKGSVADATEATHQWAPNARIVATLAHPKHPETRMVVEFPFDATTRLNRWFTSDAMPPYAAGSLLHWSATESTTLP